MKIVISANGPTIDSPFYEHFGRAPYLLVFDDGSQEPTVLDRVSGSTAAHGAGIEAANVVARSGAKVAVSGSFGPKATQALNAAGIRMVTVQADTVLQALEEARKKL